MRRPKVICFRYKRYDDIYVSNVLFSNDILRSIPLRIPMIRENLTMG